MPAKWVDYGASDGPPGTLWGLAKGSGSKPYQACVDLDGPAYRCSCPSRKFPCKHALGLLLLWSAGQVAEKAWPEWVQEWHAKRATTAAKAQARRDAPQTEAQQKAAAKRAAQRDDRVAQGVTELSQWLDDQVASGIAGLDQAAYQHWDTAAARLVDAQAPGLARRVKVLASVASSRTGWDERLLGELGTLKLLTSAYANLADLPPTLADTVRAHVGFTTPVEAVLSTPPVTDVWQVIALHDEVEERRMTTRRAWLLGRESGRWALDLSFAVAGQALPADLVIGTEMHADLCFYPGALPLRAAIAKRHTTPTRCADPAGATTIAASLDAYADALARDPWLDAWPMLVRGVLMPGDGAAATGGGTGSRWYVVDEIGDAIALRRGTESWPLLGALGGHPADIAGEWSPDGLLPLGAYTATAVVTP